MNCTITLKPSLIEFVRCAYLNGTNKVSAGDTFGKLIKPWLMIPPKDYIFNALTGEDKFTFEVPRYEDKNTEYNFFINPDGQKYIEIMLDEIFRGQLNIHLDCVVPRLERRQIKSAIYDYCYSYNISFDHINYESLKKSYYRYRSRKHKKNSSGFVPVLSLIL